MTPEQIIDALLKRFNYTSEIELFENAHIKRILSGPQDSEWVVKMHYKPVGTWHEKALINDQVDDTLFQWELLFPGFCNIGFTMMNFPEYNGTPMQLLKNLRKLTQTSDPVTFIQHELGGETSGESVGPFNKFACVLNSDIMSGRGKHWTAIFLDLSGETGTIEFFNSSGNPPYTSVLEWQQQAIGTIIRENICKSAQFIQASEIRHQFGKAECGVYSLYFIFQRLSGVPVSTFKHNLISDQKMTEFRRTHLFRET
jgi:hypothetical protein